MTKNYKIYSLVNFKRICFIFIGNPQHGRAKRGYGDVVERILRDSQIIAFNRNGVLITVYFESIKCVKCYLDLFPWVVLPVP